ncbi:MAG: lytic transglycosylase domain-containing protein [Candidatus Lambdaproteobacteria bacterium]|nr:lytic transglycosylase domain-containing protein [Candidatus Lambdaproteobacteria bacterium]
MVVRRDPRPSSVWPRLIVPSVQWLGIAAVLVAGSLLLVGGTRPPAVLQNSDEARLTPFQAQSAFSLAALHKRLPPSAIDRIQAFIEFYKKKRRRGFEDSLSRSTRYLQTYREIFREMGLPEELAFLPIIESGFNPRAVSPAQAVGVWQFTEETARRFDLHSNGWYDLRRDPIESARAAARYLRHLYETFGDWELALAAYNSGAGTVSWAQKVNRKSDQPDHFWALDLPDETRGYVPAFLAAVLIAKNPGAFGFDSIRFAPEMKYEQIKVTPGVGLYHLAQMIGMQGDELIELNPELLRGQIPPGDKPYVLRVPSGLRQRLPSQIGSTADASRGDWVLHLVHEADTLQSLSARFRAQPSRIKKVNQIQSNEDLARRSVVIIPL